MEAVQRDLYEHKMVNIQTAAQTMKPRKINKVKIIRRVGMRTARIRKKEESFCIISDTFMIKAQLQREEESCGSISQEQKKTSLNNCTWKKSFSSSEYLSTLV